jgi:DNA-binding LacI/PurR family transcriptional regulator
MRSNEAETFIRAARREQMIQATIETVAEVGFHKASLARIAERMGIAKGGIIYHFSSRDELIRAALQEVFDRLTRHMLERVGGVTSSREAVWIYVVTLVGYLDAHRERGLDADPNLRLTLAKMDLESGRAAAHRLADSGLDFDGVVAVTDTVAQGVLRGLFDRGIRVPEDVLLIGFDDIVESRYMVPSLSTVAPDHRWMAAKAVELVIARIGEPGRPTGEYFAPFELRVRESTC